MFGRGTCQGDPTSAFLFILALEILFLFIKAKPEISGLTIFDHCYLYSTYADDTTFFLKDTISIKNMVDTFHLFLEFSGLKPNLSKREITGIGVLKGVQVAVCGMRCVDLKNDTLKILGTHFSYNEKLNKGINFYATVTNIQRVLKIWKMRNFALEGKIVIFKTLAISKIVFQSMITPIPSHIVNELERTQKAFLSKNSSPKIKYESLCNDYKGGGLKNIDILNGIISLQCSWIRRLYGNSFHEWKLIPLFLLKNSFDNSFKFHSNLFFKRNKIKIFTSLYKEIFLYWKKYLTRKPEIASCIFPQYLWYNEDIQVDKNSIYLVWFSEKNINYVSQLFRTDVSIKKWLELKSEHGLYENSSFQWLQLISANPERWKFIITEKNDSKTNLIIHDRHVIKGSRILTLDKLSSTEMYSVLISKFQNKPSNFYFENLFNDNDIDWATIYILPRLATYNTYM